LTTELGVTTGLNHSKDVVLDVHDGYIKSTTTEIENQDFLVICLLPQASKRNSCGSGLVNQGLDLKTSLLGRVLSRCSLGFTEISWHSDYAFGH